VSLREDINLLMDEALRKQVAAREDDRTSHMTMISLTSNYGGQIEAYKKVLDLLDRHSST
jgi:hypothetical protein